MTKTVFLSYYPSFSGGDFGLRPPFLESEESYDTEELPQNKTLRQR